MRLLSLFVVILMGFDLGQMRAVVMRRLLLRLVVMARKKRKNLFQVLRLMSGSKFLKIIRQQK